MKMTLRNAIFIILLLTIAEARLLREHHRKETLKAQSVETTSLFEREIDQRKQLEDEHLGLGELKECRALVLSRMKSASRSLSKHLTGKLKSAENVPASFNLVSDSLVYFHPYFSEERQLIRALLLCPREVGGLRGFGMTINKKYDRNYYGFDVFGYRYECATGEFDFTDKAFPLIMGTRDNRTPVSVLKTDGSGEEIKISAGNTCSCPDGFVMKSLAFKTNEAPNYVGVNCNCARVKPNVHLTCENRQTQRVNIDRANGEPDSTLFDFVRQIPVVTEFQSNLKSVTFTLTNSSQPVNPHYIANSVFLDYTFCYIPSESTQAGDEENDEVSQKSQNNNSVIDKVFEPNVSEDNNTPSQEPETKGVVPEGDEKQDLNANDNTSEANDNLSSEVEDGPSRANERIHHRNRFTSDGDNDQASSEENDSSLSANKGSNAENTIVEGDDSLIPSAQKNVNDDKVESEGDNNQVPSNDKSPVFDQGLDTENKTNDVDINASEENSNQVPSVDSSAVVEQSGNSEENKIHQGDSSITLPSENNVNNNPDENQTASEGINNQVPSVNNSSSAVDQDNDSNMLDGDDSISIPAGNNSNQSNNNNININDGPSEENKNQVHSNGDTQNDPDNDVDDEDDDNDEENVNDDDNDDSSEENDGSSSSDNSEEESTNRNESSSPSTESAAETSPVDNNDKINIVRIHNNYRNQVATQTTSIGAQLPAAKNMRQIYWSEEVAVKAQEHANKQKYEHSTYEFRQHPQYGYLGENLGLYMSTSGPVKSWENVVKMWFDEISDYISSGQSVESFQRSTNGVIGHFTQVIWANAYLVGCGYSVFQDSDMTNTMYVCMYAPGGNWLGEPIYEKASSAGEMSCPSGTSSENPFYPGLCCVNEKCSSEESFSLDNSSSLVPSSRSSASSSESNSSASESSSESNPSASESSSSPSSADSGSSVSPSETDSGPIELSDRQTIVNTHNLFRNQLATQTTEFSAQLPLAKNMRQVYWNDEIARKAQEHADKKIYQHSSYDFRNDPKYGYLGENLGLYMSSSGAYKDWPGIVKMWNDEISDYVASGQTVENFQRSNSGVIGHFTQLNWAETYLIGCGYSVFDSDGMTNTLYVCIYGPGGNWLGESIYIPSDSPYDRECPAGTSSSNPKYSGLCCITERCMNEELTWNSYP